MEPQLLTPALSSVRATIRVLRVLLAAAVLVPALVLGAIAWDRHTAAVREAEQSVAKTVRIFQEHALKVLETHELVLDQVASRIQGLNNETIARSTDLRDFLKRLDEPRDQIASIWIIGPDGQPLTASIPWNKTINPRIGDDFLAQREKDAGTYIGRAYHGQTTNIDSFSISRRRQLADGEFTGTIHLAVANPYFSDFFQSAAPDQPNLSLLFRDDGEILASDIDPKDTFRLAVAAEWAKSTRSRQGGLAWWRTQRGGNTYIFGAGRVGNYPIYVSYGVDKATALASWYEDATLYGGIGIAASLGLCLVTLMALRHARQEALVIQRLDEALKESERSQSALHQALKMEAVGQLTGGIAHDFNNLLTVIAGNLALIGDRIAADAKAAPWIAAAQRAADRAAKLTAQLLAFARKQQLVAEPVDLNRIVAGMGGLIRSAVGGTSTIETVLAKELWPAIGDTSQIELVILNLAINARDAMGERGKVRIETMNSTELEPQRPEDPPAGDHVVVIVSDTGAGIPAEILDRVFEPFFTTKEVGKGSGLGLPQVLGVAQQLGGGVKLSSKPGEGTEVRVYLPRADTPVAPDHDEPTFVAGRRKAKILVADDEEEVRRLLVSALRGAGHDVVERDCGQAALEWLHKEGERVDLMVLDFAMPDMDGVEVAHFARRTHPRMPILFVTGFADTMALSSETQPSEILSKPFLREDLLTSVDRLLAEASQSA